ncbi:NAD(P)H-nitrite reductase large subunit [Paraburkholderia sp. UCT70]
MRALLPRAGQSRTGAGILGRLSSLRARSNPVAAPLGQPIGKGADTGPTVCSCFGVGRNTICAAIREQGLKTAAEITACLKAGGNCGSCVPELKKQLVDTKLEQLSIA